MISQNIHDFLITLSGNNNREWFQENKDWYSKAKEEFELFTSAMIQGISNFDSSIRSLTAKDCVFRIYRDVRFSKDKSPYKTNMGMYVVKDGKKSGNAGYYFHLEPNVSFIAGGMHMPEGSILKQLRQRIYDHPEDLKVIIETPEFIKAFGELKGEKLKNAPRDFPADFPEIELLKFKSYTVIRNIDDKEVISQNFPEIALDYFIKMKPLIDFLNEARKNVA